MDEVWVNGDELLERVHPREACIGRHCVLHNPSDHHMRSWPIQMRGTGLMERFCEHGIGHPDPDSVAYFTEELGLDGFGVHGCDGCCAP